MQGKRKWENPRDEESEEVLGFSLRGRQGGPEGGRQQEWPEGCWRLPLDGWVLFPRMVVGTADFAVSSVVHVSVSEIAHPVFKSQWEKWERALSTHRQGCGGHA